MFFFNDTATTEIYTLSLHDALPIYIVDFGPSMLRGAVQNIDHVNVLLDDRVFDEPLQGWPITVIDRKSTRLNSSHANISYAVFCLKKNSHDYEDHNTHIYSLV